MPHTPPYTPDQLLDKLDRLGITARTVHHAPVFTVAEAKAVRAGLPAGLPGAHTKNLFLKDKKGGLWLVVCLEDRDIDLKALRKTIGAANLSFGKPDLLMEVLGVAPGSVSPLALANDRGPRVRVVLDAAMMGMAVLNLHPLTNTATTALAASDLLVFLAFTGHHPEIVAL